MPKVSIIIPAYNIVGYIGQCIESALGQTFNDIEIIVVDDGSTDGTHDKIAEYAERDDRIRVLTQPNSGLGPARNLGIRAATGEYLAFLDGDDWYAPDYVEKMYGEAERAGADLVHCGYYRYDDTTGMVVSEHIPKAYDRHSAFEKIQTAMWVKMVRKIIFDEYKIEMPNLVGEDAAVHCYILSKAMVISRVRLPLYYYRVNRRGSIMYDYRRHMEHTADYLEYGISMFKADGTFDRYKEQLCAYSKDCIRIWINAAIRNSYDFSRWKWNVCASMEKHFPGFNALYDRRHCCIGSYSLYRALHLHILLDGAAGLKTFSYSGLISFTDKQERMAETDGFNAFRAEALAKDFGKTLINDIRDIAKECSCLFIDFLEERFDLVRMDGGCYTKSDAFEQLDLEGRYEIIDRFSNEANAMWEGRCMQFIDILKKRFGAGRVVLVKNYLMEQKGYEGPESEFDEIAEIRRQNRQIDQCYRFFMANYGELPVIEIRDNSLLYTDIDFMHGCHPWHYNGAYYDAVGEAALECCIRIAERQPYQAQYAERGHGAEHEERQGTIGLVGG